VLHRYIATSLHRYIATCSLFLAVTQSAVAQLTEEGSAKGSPPSLVVSIQGPMGPVPIGTKQVLVAGHDSVALPRYEWVAHCLKKGKDGKLKEHEPHRTQADWNKIQIKDCWGYESIVKYRVDVNHATVGIGPGSSDYIIEYKSPNWCDIKADPLKIEGNAFVTPRKTTLFLKNGTKKEPIGPCALVCCTEDWQWFPNKSDEFMLNAIPYLKLNGFPKCETPSSKYRVDGSKDRFSGGTWDWESPTLTDTQWFLDFPQLDNYDVGDSLGAYRIKYTFRGPKCPMCNDCQWEKCTELFTCALKVDIVDGKKVVRIVSNYNGGNLR